MGDIMGGHILDLDVVVAHRQGVAEGEARGEIKTLSRLVCHKLRKGKTVPQITDELEENENRIKRICYTATGFAPDYDEELVIKAIISEGSESNEDGESTVRDVINATTIKRSS